MFSRRMLLTHKLTLVAPPPEGMYNHRPIPEYKGKYGITDTGRVIRYKKVSTDWKNLNFLEIAVRPKGARGHLIFRIQKKMYYLAPMVLEIFVRKAEPGEVVLFKDGNIHNCNLTNLEWVMENT